MDIERFWQLIESSRRGFSSEQVDGNMERQREELHQLLMKLSPQEVISFRDLFFEQMDVAFRWELWGAAYLIAGGCSDDGFADFRGWLISMGRRIFEAAVENPESLVGVAETPGVEDVFFEELPYVPAQVHEALTGRELPEYAGHTPSSPCGRPWREEELPQRFPRLWARYGTR